MNMGFKEITVNPEALRFSQESIASYMLAPWGENVPLRETLEKLRRHQLDPDGETLGPDVFPLMEVCRDADGVLWSSDNRRLWLFRMAGIQQIKVKLSDRPLYRAAPRDARLRAQMSGQDFFPKIRGESQMTASIHTQLVEDESQKMASTSTQLMENDSNSLLYGAAATAAALMAAYSGWKAYKNSRE